MEADTVNQDHLQETVDDMTNGEADMEKQHSTNVPMTTSTPKPHDGCDVEPNMDTQPNMSDMRSYVTSDMFVTRSETGSTLTDSQEVINEGNVASDESGTEYILLQNPVVIRVEEESHTVVTAPVDGNQSVGMGNTDMQMLMQMLQTMNQKIEQGNLALRQDNKALNEKIDQGRQDTQTLSQNIQVLRQDNQTLSQNIQVLRQETQSLRQETQSLRQEVKHRFDQVEEKFIAITSDINQRFENFEKDVDKKIAASTVNLKKELECKVEESIANRIPEQQEHIAQVKSLVEKQAILCDSLDKVQTAVGEVKSVCEDLPDQVLQISQDLGFLKLVQTKTISDVEALNKKVETGICEQDTTLAQKVVQEHKTYIEEVENIVKENETKLIARLQADLQKVEEKIRSEIVSSRADSSTPDRSEEMGIRKSNQHYMDLGHTSDENKSNYVGQADFYKPPEHREIKKFADTETDKNITDPVTGLVKAIADESLLKYRQFPKFDPRDKNTHPAIFIKAFTNIFPSSWPEERKIQFVTGCMMGDALTWAADVGEMCRTYEEFERQFLNKFWSMAIQQRVRREVFNPPPYNRKKGSLRAYFEKFINKARYFTYPVSYIDLIQALKNKLPQDIVQSIALVPDNDIEHFLLALDAVDLASEQGLRPEYKNNQNYPQNNNFSSNFTSNGSNGGKNHQNQVQFHQNPQTQFFNSNNFQNPGNFQNNSNFQSNRNQSGGNGHVNNNYKKFKNKNKWNNFNGNQGWHPYKQPNSWGNQHNFNHPGMNNGNTFNNNNPNYGVSPQTQSFNQIPGNANGNCNFVNVVPSHTNPMVSNLGNCYVPLYQCPSQKVMHNVPGSCQHPVQHPVQLIEVADNNTPTDSGNGGQGTNQENIIRSG